MPDRGTWTIQTKESGDAWASTDTIAPPNDNLVIRKITTQVKIKGADGDNLFMTPSTKYTDEPLVWVWYEDTDGTIKDQVEGYVEAQTDLKIIDDLNNEWIGRFISVDSTRIVGFATADDKYDVRAVFEQMPSLA